MISPSCLPPTTLPSPTQILPPSLDQNNTSIFLPRNCKTIQEFKQVHTQLIKTGQIHTTHQQNQSIAFCALEAGDMGYARHLFDEIPHPNIFIWNTMIKGYSRRSSPGLAVFTYLEMLQKGFEPDHYTFPFLFKSFTREIASMCAQELHSHIVKFGFDSNAFVQNALIHTYALFGRIDSARQVFDKSLKRDVITWNAMILGYNRCKRFDDSCRVFDEMEIESVEPTSVTFVLVLSACTKLRDLNFGRRVHSRIENSNIDGNLILQNALIDMYAVCGEMDVALGLFNNMKVKDVISWTAIVTGFINLGQVDRARDVFDRMPERDFVSWTAMIDGYLRANRFKEALGIFRRMQVANIRPDEFTMVSVLSACAHLGALEVGEWIRVYIEKNDIKTDVYVGNALIDMYSKCGSIENAMEIFQKMPEKDKFTWTAVIVGLATNGHGDQAIDMFYKMLKASMRPDEVTYIGVLSACTHGGMVEKGREFFARMTIQHGITPNVAHYGCLVDLLGRAGRLEDALEIIENMPMKPNSVVWGALLSACRVHKDVKLAEIAAKSLLDLEPQNGAVYVLLSNVYAVCNRWEDVRKVRNMMVERGIHKTPGCSLIEMNGMVHEFAAGERSHLRSDEIYSKLDEMLKEVKSAGYTPDKGEVLLDIGEEEKENAIYWHSEKLAIAFGLIESRRGATIRIVKNLRMCVDCHRAMKFISEVYDRQIIVRDRTRFHHFKNGLCSCKDYW